MNRKWTELDIEEIRPRTDLRLDSGDLSTLSSSIRKMGLLHPIVVDNRNTVISGRRRLEACRMAGVVRVPVLKLDVAADSMTALDIQSDENLCRLPLAPDDLENLIQRKKSAMGGRPGKPGGALGWVRKVFSRSEDG
jgi:ParB family chromosome partitioning protein